MTATLSALREEHRELLRKIERLKQVADVIDEAPANDLVSDVEEADTFLEHDLRPHAKAEEDVLYHAYDQVANSPWATDTLRRDHAAIAALREELARTKTQLSTQPLPQQQKHDLMRIFYGLHTLIKLHFGHEEDLVLPRIENALTQEAADQLMQSMAEAAQAH